MRITLNSAADLGPLIRIARKAQGLRQDDAAGSIGVSENFLGKVERGSDSVQWGKLFQVLDELGIQLIADLPEEATGLLSQARGQPKADA
jgi:transcriptional regulator with XRE-family HTH domain